MFTDVLIRCFVLARVGRFAIDISQYGGLQASCLRYVDRRWDMFDSCLSRLQSVSRCLQMDCVGGRFVIDELQTLHLCPDAFCA